MRTFRGTDGIGDESKVTIEPLSTLILIVPAYGILLERA